VSGLSDSTLLIWDVAGVRGARKAGSLDAAETARAWADLGTDAHTAFAARGALADSPESAMPVLKNHLAPVRPVDAEQLRRLLADLDSDMFAVREAAQKELMTLGELAAPSLRQALERGPSPEARRRIKVMLNKIHEPITQPAVRPLRAVAVLEDTATPEAKQLLEQLAGGAPDGRLTREAKAALERLARRSRTAP
jgi:hypothetical protein